MRAQLQNLASETAVYGVFTIVGRFLTFLLTPIYSNYLTMEEVGDINNIYSIIAFIMVIYCFGMESSFFRFYEKDNFEINKKVYSHTYLTIALISFAISSVFIIFSSSIAPAISDLPNAINLILIASLIPFFDALMIIPYTFLRMTRQAKKFSMIRFVLIIVAVALNFLFVVYLRWGAEGVLYAQMIANVIGVMIFIPNVIQYFKFSLDLALLKQMLKFGLPTIPASLSSIVLQVADRPILKALTNNTEVGMYSVNYRLGIPMMLFVAVFDYAWKPFYLSHYQEENAKRLFSRVLTYFTLACSAVFLLTSLFIPYFVQVPFIGGKFINPDYWVGMGIIPIILAGYFLNGIFVVFSAGFYITKKTQYLPIAVGIAAFVNIAMNFVLIPIIGYWGAAWATFAAYLVSAGVLYYFQQKIYPLTYEFKRVILIISLSLLLYLGIILIADEFFKDNGLIFRVLAILLFVFLLWLFNFFTKGELDFIKKLFKR